MLAGDLVRLERQLGVWVVPIDHAVHHRRSVASVSLGIRIKVVLARRKHSVVADVVLINLTKLAPLLGKPARHSIVRVDGCFNGRWHGSHFWEMI